MSADAGAGIIVPDTHNPERFRRILRQFAEVNDIGRLLPGHEFNRHIQMPADDLVHRRLRNAIPSRSHKADKEEPVFEDNTGDLTVDLHIERIPGSDGIPEWAALDFQMNYFRQVLRKNLKHRGRRIIFIHGIGDGTLAAALRKELDEVFALSCTYTYSTPGITNVTIR